MSYKPQLTINEIFLKSPVLKTFWDKTTILTKLETLVQSKLDPKIASNCKVANFNNGILILQASTPAWGHSLRFASSDLLSDLRKEMELCALKSIKITVEPDKKDYIQREITPIAPLTIFAKKELRKAAESLENLPQLQIALINLSNN